MKLKALGLLWRAALLLRQFWILNHRCFGTAPAECWIPTNDDGTEGYYRGGILRRYCYRFVNHSGRCLAPIDEMGHEHPGGAEFAPEPLWHPERTSP